MKSQREFFKLVAAKVDEIAPLLNGLGPEVQGAILADLIAMYLAGHVGPDAKRAREAILAVWLEHMRKLIPVNEEILLARIGDDETAH